MDISCENYQKVIKKYGKAIPAPKTAVSVPRSRSVKVRSFSGHANAFVEKMLYAIDNILDTLSASRVISAVRVAICVVCFIAIIGIIGGIEQGTISFGAGVTAAMVVAFVEVICIKKRG